MVFINEERPKKFVIKENIIIGNPKKGEKDGISKLILNSLTNYPDFVAQINVKTGEKTTNAQIKDRSVRCGLWLRKQGIGKNDIVCVSTPHQTNDIIPCLATFYVGAILNPWYHNITPVEARRFMNMIKPKMVFADIQTVDLLSRTAKEANVNCKFVVYQKNPDYPSLQEIMDQQTAEEVENFVHDEPEDPHSQVGVIFFSSGTTGNQKGTMLSYDTLVNHRYESMLINKCTRAMWYSSLSWITGTNMTTLCLRHRITRIIHEDFEPEETSKVIQNQKIDFLFITPSMLSSMCKAEVFNRYDFSSVLTIVVGGSKPSKIVLEKAHRALPHCLVSNCFGMTELGGCLTVQEKNPTDIGSIGFIVEGAQMKVIDINTDKILGPNQQGELCFLVENVMLGYWNNPDETKEMIDDEGWVHTGDLGYYDESGEITIMDRNKEVIISKNHHISPSEIENILMNHPGVDNVAVVPVPHSIDIERPLAFVVKSDRSKVTAEELVELPVTINKNYRLTGGVVFVDKLPYTPNGKKALRTLKEMAKPYAQ